METVIVTMVAFALVLLALSIGVLFGRRPLSGSCGGVGGQCACGAASVEDCRQETSAPQPEAERSVPGATP